MLFFHEGRLCVLRRGSVTPKKRSPSSYWPLPVLKKQARCSALVGLPAACSALMTGCVDMIDRFIVQSKENLVTNGCVLGIDNRLLVKKAFLLLKIGIKKGQIFFLIVLLRQIS